MLRLPLLFGMLCLFASAQVESPETVYDFGTVPQGTKIVHRFSIHNSTPVPVTVQGLELRFGTATSRTRQLLPKVSDWARVASQISDILFTIRDNHGMSGCFSFVLLLGGGAYGTRN
jgi:hypothetical protein